MRTKHILVVEDSDEDFETVRDAARRGGVSRPIVRALSGDECLRLLRGASRRRDALPALVLMDLNTPGDDGREALREIRGEPSLAALPLVVLSASANPRDLQFCYQQGANAYHVKPVEHAAHLLVLQQIFSYWLGSVVLPA
ncbi:response regulator [Ideonella sp. A 288]|uniref:response regulator n=1 Tax=Ideonella sp. A 288 TaxID=1962181 RepID=UPI000B4AF14B|nr:response regulator [Ideonella sp. A 288]